MVRNPDESQGQSADPETHASGIPSINDPVFGLVVSVNTVKEDGEERLRNAKGGDVDKTSDEKHEYGSVGIGGTGGRFAILSDEDVVVDDRLSGGNEGEDIASPVRVGERPDHGDGDVMEGSEVELFDYEEKEEKEPLLRCTACSRACPPASRSLSPPITPSR